MMAHYAFLDAANIVTEVIVGKDENDGGVDWEAHYAEVRGLPASQCRRTSYNTLGGVHLNGGVPFRHTYAGIGFRFDPDWGEEGGFFAPAPDVAPDAP